MSEFFLPDGTGENFREQTAPPLPDTRSNSSPTPREQIDRPHQQRVA